MTPMPLGPLGLLLILVGLGGSPSLPVSMPPLPPDPVIERAAPDECLLHVALAGLAKPAAGSANHAEALLAEAEVQRFIGELGAVVGKMMQRLDAPAASAGPRLSPEMQSLLFTLLTRPAALTVDFVKPAAPAVRVEGSLVVSCGPAVEQVRQALDKAVADVQAMTGWKPARTFELAGQKWSKWSRFEGLPDGTPDIAWGFKGDVFVAAVGTDALEHLLGRLAAENRQPPAWKTALEKRLPLERRSLLAHWNVPRTIDAARELSMLQARPEMKQEWLEEEERAITAAIQGSGLGGLQAVQAVAGLTKTEMAAATVLDFNGQPTGFFASGKGVVTAADLKAIPADATMAQVVKLDPAAMLAAWIAWLESVEFQSADALAQRLGQIRAVVGFDVNDHLLEPLGDTWTVFTLPGGGPLPPVAAAVTLDDAKTFTKTHASLLGVLRQAAARPGMPPLELAERKSGETTIFTVGLTGAPLQPAWCIHGDRLLVAASPDLLEKLIARDAAAPSLADVAAARALLGERTAAIGYQEPKAAVAGIAALYDAFAKPGMAAAKVALPNLPATDVVVKHLLPAVSVVRRDAAGDVIVEGRSSLPLGRLGGAGLASSPATAGMAVALTLPAVQAARESARRTAAANNLRLIAQTMLVYESTHRKFPSAAICDKAGKPLLSWRVAILPFLEESELFNQFRLDEPWDSEHNKQFLEKMPLNFTSPGQDGAKPGMTRYVVPTGKKTAFPTPAVAATMNDFRDGTSKTILVVEAEAGKAVPWTKPDDLAIDPDKPHAGLKNSRPGGFFAAFVDTHVQLIPADVAADVLAALFTPAGNEPNHAVE